MRSPFHAASPRLNSPMHPSAGGGRSGSGFISGGGGPGMGRGRGRRDSELIGQTIKITHGPYKGKYLCIYIFCLCKLRQILLLKRNYLNIFSDCF